MKFTCPKCGVAFDTLGLPLDEVIVACPNCSENFEPQPNSTLPLIRVSGVSKCMVRQNNLSNPNNEGDTYATVEFSAELGGIVLDVAHTSDGETIVLNLRSARYATDIYIDANSGEIERTEIRK
jgi:hypothetical protein